MSKLNGRKLRSQDWFSNASRPDMSAVYLERFMNYGLTPDELVSGRPVVGIAQTGSDLAPCNRVHIELAKRVRDGIRDAGGIPMEFPVHPIFENCRRPTAALDRNLAYLGLVEVLNGFPLDGVVLTSGCDKTTPSGLMAAATMDLPAIVLNSGPMLDGNFEGEAVASGTVIWQCRRRLAAGEITERQFFDAALASAQSVGHCNAMGTAMTMNLVAEALGMALPGAAAIPAAYRARSQMAYETGRRIVGMIEEDLVPSRIMTRAAFRDAITCATAAGGSTNAQPHITAIARHMGVDLDEHDWVELSHIPLLVNVKPAGTYLCESFYRAGGVPALMAELAQAGKLATDRITATGNTLAQNLAGVRSKDVKVIRPFDDPLAERAGLVPLSGNLFDFAIMKTSAISLAFRQRYLQRPGAEEIFEGRAVVFDGSEDYHARINDADLEIDENCILVMRGAGPIGWPGSAEVVNMQPPDALIRAGIEALPTIGDGRQSGTSDAPSIVHATPEAVNGGGLAWLKTGDVVRVDLKNRRCDALVDEAEIARRKKDLQISYPESATPWEELFRQTSGPLETGACIEQAVAFRAVGRTLPRHNH